MKWRTNPLEGWHTAFAWFPVPLSSGETVWMENYRFYVSPQGLITTIIGMPK
jgi:hypothetical protein